ncbi:hypothetical protein FQN57_003471 [Myotisia sp. PD_48]|nr:hypothetical protein FQN57_003471 [Myotisia sp. PD_48]
MPTRLGLPRDPEESEPSIQHNNSLIENNGFSDTSSCSPRTSVFETHTSTPYRDVPAEIHPFNGSSSTRQPAATVRQSSHNQDDDNTLIPQPPSEPDDKADDEKSKPVTWRSLPRKGQLIILTISRLSEPLAQTSLQAYMYYQLRSFDPSLPDSTISAQSGILQGTFTAAQFFTAIFWGRLADTHYFGRKRVLLIGLFGTGLSAVGFGFSRSFATAAFFRTLGGALNSNSGIMKTMISEIIQEKKYQSRAFLLLPMCFNIGVIIGPVLGGILADPISAYPGAFGPGSWIGGKEGVWWMKQWPYALPNLVSAVFILVSTLAIFLGLDESHETARFRHDRGRLIGKAISRYLGFSQRDDYQPLDGTAEPDTLDDFIGDDCTVPSNRGETDEERLMSLPPKPERKRLPFKDIWTRNVILTLLTHLLLTFHTSSFNALAFIFLPAPRAPHSRNGFFHFGGGLGMPSSKVGLATAVIGFIGLPLQIFAYPRVQLRLGTIRAFRYFLPFSPLAYSLAPFLVLIPDVPHFVWPALSVVIALQCLSRTFSLPATSILVNNCVPDPSVLATVHGVAQSIASAGRTLGPLISGWGLGLGLNYNIVGAIWWSLAVEASVGWLLTWAIYEGDGLVKLS